MKGRKLLAAALLAGMVSSPVVMAEVLSDDALGEVSAQGLQIAVQTSGAATQNMNNDSTQLNNNAQSNAAGMAITNASSSAANVGQNVAGVIDSSDRDTIRQTNNQYAANSEYSGQGGYQEDVDVAVGVFGVFANVQNMNNGSTQLNDGAQAAVTGMAVTNAASSAVNVGQNVAGLVDSGALGLDDQVYQTNVQVAENTGLNEQYDEQIDVDVSVLSITLDFDRQNINNGSTQLNGGAQIDAAGMAISNVASSAANVGQNVAGVVRSSVDDIAQRNNQYAANDRVNGHLALQGDGDGVLIALNIDLDRQNINNGSVQLNDGAQAFAAGMAITNAASSAANVAQNVAGLVDSTTAGIPDDITQSNKQVALNAAGNYQDSVQLDLDLGLGVTVDIDEQSANNGSVQLNDGAQAFAAGMAITNVASSALNIGQNVIGIVNSSGDDVRQFNNQYAEDGSENMQTAYSLNFDGAYVAINFGDVHTNNGSVQLNDDAQALATGMAITNAAGSAVNVGQNVMGMINGYSGTITQVNVQSAVNY